MGSAPLWEEKERGFCLSFSTHTHLGKPHEHIARRWQQVQSQRQLCREGEAKPKQASQATEDRGLGPTGC